MSKTTLMFLLITLVGCEMPRSTMLRMQANGDFQGCLRSADALIEVDKSKGEAEKLGLDHFYAAECNEALGNRSAALESYLVAARLRNGPTKSDDRIAALRRGEPLRTAAAIQAEAAEMIGLNTTVADDTESDSTASQAAMLGMLAQPRYAAGRRAPTYTPSTAFSPGSQASAGNSASQGRCPPPTVSRSPRDGQMNAGWITVNSNCDHTVTVDIHTVSLYQTRPRTEQTQSVQIGRTASFWCDGKREGCVVEMVGYR